jgi:hypothetical protein
MEDIKIIGGDLCYDKIKVLPFTYDRIQAIFYHCKSIETHCSHQDFLKAKWHFRGTLSEFKSLFDIFPYDLRKLFLDKIWEKRERSKFVKNLERESCVLIQILNKTRDLAIHTAHIKGDIHKFLFTYLDGSGEHKMVSELIFIDPVCREYSKELKNFFDEEITWFNRQTQIWPAHLLIKEAVFLACIEIINFLIENKIVSPIKI